MKSQKYHIVDFADTRKIELLICIATLLLGALLALLAFAPEPFRPSKALMAVLVVLAILPYMLRKRYIGLPLFLPLDSEARKVGQELLEQELETDLTQAQEGLDCDYLLYEFHTHTPDSYYLYVFETDEFRPIEMDGQFVTNKIGVETSAMRQSGRVRFPNAHAEYDDNGATLYFGDKAVLTNAETT